MPRQEVKNRKKNARKVAACAAKPICGGFAEGEPAVSLGWSVDFCEMADRIAREGSYGVPNRDRDLLAKNAPLGTFTPRDGQSIRPVYRDVANAL